MADLKPPKLDADELTTVLALLQYQRESLLRKIDGVSEADMRRGFVSSGTTLLWLLKHLARAEELWFVVRFAGEPSTLGADTVLPDDTVADCVDTYRSTWARVDAIVSAATLDELCCNIGDDTPVPLRWVLMHMLEETARHAGHADILRELIDGNTGR